MKKFVFHQILIGVTAAIVVALALFLWPRLVNEKSDGAPVFSRANMVIQRADGQAFSYAVEVATTPQQDMYGLMFRHSLPKDTGMIFVYDIAQPVSMWMKNTYIPLDMLFVRGNGTIVKIITHARPLNIVPIPSDEPVRGVIEINAGEADKHGLKIGDKVLFPAFSDQP